MLIGAVIGLLVVAGVVAVGVQVTGSRSGTIVSAPVCKWGVTNAQTTWALPSADVKYVKITWTGSDRRGYANTRSSATYVSSFPFTVSMATPSVFSPSSMLNAFAEVQYGPRENSLTPLAKVGCTS